MHVPCFLSAVVLPRPCASIRRAASGRPAVRFIVAQAYDPMSPPPSSSSSVSMNEDNGSQDKDATTTTSTPNGSYAAVEENALALGKEIATRPVFYSVLAVWTVTGVLALSVSGSVLGSINRLPIIPDVLRLVSYFTNASSFFLSLFISYLSVLLCSLFITRCFDGYLYCTLEPY